MLKKILIASCLLVTSMASHAAIISHFGYERDSASIIVTGGGLEWLKWDVTQGQSINQALSNYNSEGWSLATNAQMAVLLNVFQFGKRDWSVEETMDQWFRQAWSPNEDSVHNMFISLFGATFVSDACMSEAEKNCFEDEDRKIFARARFGSDSNNNGVYNSVEVVDDASYRSAPWGPMSSMHEVVVAGDECSFCKDWTHITGIALVRPVTATATPVPLPGSTSLLALGLVALRFRSRQAFRR